MPGHRKPEQLSSSVTHDDKRKQALERQGWNDAKIDCSNGIRMVAQECRPVL
jgi:hypothetical protein